MFGMQYSPVLDHVVLVEAVNMIKSPDGLRATQGPAAFAPVVNRGSHRIEWDEILGTNGILTPTHMDADIPKERWPGIDKLRLDAPTFRVEYDVPESKLTLLRQPGTREQRLAISEVTAMSSEWISNRCDISVEWSVWQALQDGTLTLVFGDGTTMVINYRTADDLQPILTGTAKWSDPAESDPLDDIESWKNLARDFGFQIGGLIFGGNVERYLAQNAKIRQWVIRQADGDEMLAGGRIPQGMLGSLPHESYDQTYEAVDYLGADYTSGTTLTLQSGATGQLANLTNNERIVIGRSTHSNNTRGREAVTVTGAPVGTSLTLSEALDFDFQAGDRVVWNREFMHPDGVLLLPRMTNGQWMEWYNAPSIHNDFAGGKYIKEEFNMNSIPLRGALRGGIDGLPRFRVSDHHIFAIVA